MGSIKDRNGMDLTEAEDIKKRWQEYTEELYKKRKTPLQVITNIDYSSLCYTVNLFFLLHIYFFLN